MVTSEEQPADLSQVRTGSIPAGGAPARSGSAFPEPIKVKTVPLGMDLRGVRTTAGDFNADDLGPYEYLTADDFIEQQEELDADYDEWRLPPPGLC